MRRTTITTTVTIPLDVEYSCSKCGTQNCQKSYVQESGDSTAYGSAGDDWYVRSKMEVDSKKLAKNNMDSKIEQIVNDAKIYKYRKAELKCKCKNCNRVEPWARMRFSRFQEFLIWFVGILLLLSMAAFMGSDIHDGTQLLLTAISIICCWFIYKKICYTVLEKKILKLPKKSLPSLFITVKNDSLFGNRVSLTPQLEKEKHLEIENTPVINIDGTNNSKTMYCRKCGSKILADSIFCVKCGEEVKHI